MISRKLAVAREYSQRGGILALSATAGLAVYFRQSVVNILMADEVAEDPVGLDLQDDTQCHSNPQRFRRLFLLGTSLVWAGGVVGGWVYGFCSAPPPIEAEKRVILERMLSLKDLLAITLDSENHPELVALFSYWLDHGKGKKYQAEVAQFSRKFQKLLDRNGALRPYKRAILGDQYIEGLIQGQTALLDEFLDDFPAISLFLFKEFSKESSILDAIHADFLIYFNKWDQARKEKPVLDKKLLEPAQTGWARKKPGRQEKHLREATHVPHGSTTRIQLMMPGGKIFTTSTTAYEKAAQDLVPAKTAQEKATGVTFIHGALNLGLFKEGIELQGKVGVLADLERYVKSIQLPTSAFDALQPIYSPKRI